MTPDDPIRQLTDRYDREAGAYRDLWASILKAASGVTRHDRFNTAGKLGKLFEDAGFTSVRSWDEELAPMIDRERLLGLRTQMGSSKPRFDSLSAETRESCVSEAIRRMERLAPDDFVARGRTVHAIASA